ncbi:glycosyltransferase [Carboxylicivirga sediminis]|uniref:Glycosyltransferase n=1 Tax=Carboxylicivirga sediminis TaxID=2006564 RepID=A0A941FDH2_9BACT|nr:glycosyltransferase [Carboxylicivirga sediminis]MBR8538360.1 glycosyltransferase [Carboxylicivirga sediminis]
MSQQTHRKKILIFIDWFLPGYKAGGPVRSMANMVAYLKEDYLFYIVTRNTDYTETIPYKTVNSNCWESFSENVNVYYADEAHQNKLTYKGILNEVVPDIVYINGVYSWKFSILPLLVAKKASSAKVIVATRGMLAASAIDVKGGKKKLFLKLARMAGLYKRTIFHATNEKEKQDINRVLGQRLQVQVADNLPKKVLPEFNSIEKHQGELKLVSLARIAPEKNTLFALKKLSELGSFQGHISFDLYGQIYNEDYWHQCEDIICRLPENIRVEHKGTVDAELVGATIQKYHSLFMPTRGENFGHVILESLSAGRPVLISDQTPWRELQEVKAGWDVSLELKSRKVELSTKTREEVKGVGLKTEKVEKGTGLKVKGETFEARSPKTGSGEWCQVLRTLLEMEQEKFDAWCEGARRRAEGFVNNPALKEQYLELF